LIHYTLKVSEKGRKHNEGFYMVIILPRKISGLRTVESAIQDGVSYENILEVLNESPKNIVLNFPKFSMESSTDFIDPLREIGINTIFDEKVSDLSRISKQDGEELFVSKLRQKTYLSVNEGGSEAGAATFGMSKFRRRKKLLLN